MNNEQKAVLMAIFTALILGFAFFVIVMFLTGCQVAPVRTDYDSKQDYKIADCLYRNQNKPELCMDEMKEGRAVDRYNFCKDEALRDKSHDFEKCWIYRNQK